MDLGVLNIVPLDFGILFVIWIAFSVLSLQGGRGEVISIMLGAFIGLAVFDFAQHAFWVSSALQGVLAQPKNAAVLLGVLTVLGYFATRQLMLPYGSDLIGSPTQSAVIGFLTTVVLLALWIATPDTAAIWNFSPVFHQIFAEQFTFWWIAGALAAMVIFG